MFVRKWRFFFFNDTATTEIYTLSLHDALPISELVKLPPAVSEAYKVACEAMEASFSDEELEDRKSTRLNSSHANILYAVFCLKKNNIFYLQHLPAYYHLTLIFLDTTHTHVSSA